MIHVELTDANDEILQQEIRKALMKIVETKEFRALVQDLVDLELERRCLKVEKEPGSG